MMDTADVVAISGLTGLFGTLAASEAADTASVEVRVASALTDAAWAEICAAAKHTPDAEARAVLSAILFEQYPAFAYNRARWATAAKRAKRMLKQLSAFEADYRAQPSPDGTKAEAHLRGLRLLRSYVEAMWCTAWTIRHANRGRKNEQRMLLYHWLCTLWLEHFHAELTYSRPEGGGKPYGPLIAFMLTAMRQVMPEDELPSPETLRDFIDDYRAARQRLLEEIRKRERIVD